jgi:hypothetical protein
MLFAPNLLSWLANIFLVGRFFSVLALGGHWHCTVKCGWYEFYLFFVCPRRSWRDNNTSKPVLRRLAIVFRCEEIPLWITPIAVTMSRFVYGGHLLMMFVAGWVLLFDSMFTIMATQVRAGHSVESRVLPYSLRPFLPSRTRHALTSLPSSVFCFLAVH